jgi:aspartyl-tRNA(Asn)/glutamyl-tRNA(Gln) amidotransferase subunit C
MGTLSKKDIEHIAKLANLPLTSSETDKFQKQLSDVVGYISSLEEVDTKDIEPTSQTTGLENVYRTDQIKEENVLSVNEATSGTEEIHNNYFKIPAIFTNKEE